MPINLLPAALAIIIFLAACDKPPAVTFVETANEETERTIINGKIIGSITTNGAHRWAKIPFASPPVGDLRWRPPEPAQNWTGTLPALDSSTKCLQIGDGTDATANSGRLTGSEDCLYLNIWAPPFTKDNVPANADKLPVMVFIHGGSNRSGFGGLYNSEKIAKDHNLIAVTINYRLGPLGWFSHEALQNAKELSIENSPNYGTLDIIAALNWVQDNIASFGGDPGRVTIFGESAGGHNISSLLAMPAAQGLFHGAIIQSGYFTSRSIKQAREGIHKDNGWQYMGSKQIVFRLNPPENASLQETAEFLRNVTPEQLFAAAAAKNGEPESAMFIADNILLPDQGIEYAIENAEFAIVPLITGTNRDETKLFNISDPELVTQFLGQLPRPRDSQMYDLMAKYPSMMWRARAVDEQAQRITAKQQNPVFAYRFDWDESGRFLGSDFAHLLGAAHAIELPFVFGIFDTFPGSKQIFPPKGKVEREQLATVMQSYWAEFAYSANPARGRSKELPLWDRWGKTDRTGQVMIFDSDSAGGVRMIEQIIETDDVYRLLTDHNPDMDRTKRCKIILEVVGWFPETKNNAKGLFTDSC